MELWDIYDKNRNRTGKCFHEGMQLSKGEYGYIVHIILRNKSGKYLLQQRAFTKTYYPGMWDATCGRVQHGEDGRTAAVREVREELGLNAAPSDLRLLYHDIYHDSVLLDIFLLELDFSCNDCVLQKEEVAAVGLFSFDDMLKILSSSKDGEYLNAIKNGC